MATETFVEICARCLKHHAGKCAVIGSVVLLAAMPVAEAAQGQAPGTTPIPIYVSGGATSYTGDMVMEIRTFVVDGVAHMTATPKLWQFVEQTPGETVVSYKGTIQYR